MSARAANRGPQRVTLPAARHYAHAYAHTRRAPQHCLEVGAARLVVDAHLADAQFVACVASGRYRRVELSGAQAGVRHLGARRAVHQRDTHTAQAHREAQMWLHGASAGGGSELLTGGAKRERAPGRWRGRLAANDDLNHALMALRAYAAAQAQVGRAT